MNSKFQSHKQQTKKGDVHSFKSNANQEWIRSDRHRKHSYTQPRVDRNLSIMSNDLAGWS